MRNFTIFLLFLSQLGGYQCLKSQNERAQEHYIYAKSVTIVDSAFMDLIVRTLSSDSIAKLLQKTIPTNMPFKQYIKTGFVNIEIQERHDFESDSVFKEFLNDSIKKIIDNNSNLKQVVVSMNDVCSCLSKYVTKYKGYRFFFDKEETIEGKNLFKKNKRIFKYPWNLQDFDQIWRCVYIPFILYDNNLYIDPEEIQWFVLYE